MSAPGNNSGNDDQVRQFTVRPDDDGVRLDRWFKRNLPQIGFATVSRWARTGQVRVDGKRAKPEDRLAVGQVVRVPPGGATPERSETPRRELTEEQLDFAESMVITQDRAAIVLNKPPGLATQGGTKITEHVDGLLDAFTMKGPRPHLVHRLDKDTSGVLLVARTPGNAAYFSKRFAGRSARKIYWALIVGVPDIRDGLIDLPLAKQPGTGGEKMMVDESEHGQIARTRYRVIDRAGNRAAWVELQPLTGRTHQLRVHMAAIGHPIVGDGKYGGQDAFLTGSISRKMHLHARRLIIDHPDGAPLDVTAELPEHFAASMAQLGFDEADGAQLPEPVVEPEREAKKRAAKAHAKEYRKERRGERRKRADAPKDGKAGARRTKATGGKPTTRGGAATGKPARGSGQTARGDTAGGKPARGSAPGKPPHGGGVTGGKRPGGKPVGTKGKR